MKKAKKNSAPKQDPKLEVLRMLAKISAVFTGHAVVVMFVLAGATIGIALVRARSYLNPVRDEARFEDESTKNQYGKIDYTLVKRLQDSLDSEHISVSQKIVPNRKSPFSE